MCLKVFIHWCRGYITLFGPRGTNIFEIELEVWGLNVVGKSNNKDMHIKNLS